MYLWSKHKLRNVSDTHKSLSDNGLVFAVYSYVSFKYWVEDSR